MKRQSGSTGSGTAATTKAHATRAIDEAIPRLDSHLVHPTEMATGSHAAPARSEPPPLTQRAGYATSIGGRDEEMPPAKCWR